MFPLPIIIRYVTRSHQLALYQLVRFSLAALVQTFAHEIVRFPLHNEIKEGLRSLSYILPFLHLFFLRKNQMYYQFLFKTIT